MKKRNILLVFFVILLIFINNNWLMWRIDDRNNKNILIFDYFQKRKYI